MNNIYTTEINSDELLKEQQKDLKCECGKHKHKFFAHSFWCPSSEHYQAPTENSEETNEEEL